MGRKICRHGQPVERVQIIRRLGAVAAAISDWRWTVDEPKAP